MKSGNIVPRVGIEPTSLAFPVSVLSLHRVGSMMSPLYPHLPVYAAPCLRGQRRLLHSFRLIHQRQRCVTNMYESDAHRLLYTSQSDVSDCMVDHCHHRLSSVTVIITDILETTSPIRVPATFTASGVQLYI